MNLRAQNFYENKTETPYESKGTNYFSANRQILANARPPKFYEPKANHVACSDNASAAPPPQPRSSFFFFGLPPLQGHLMATWNVSNSNGAMEKNIKQNLSKTVQTISATILSSIVAIS